MNEIEALTNRIKTLETRFRKVKAGAAIAVVCIAAIGLMGQARLPDDVLPGRLQRFENRPIVDAALVPDEVRSHHIVLLDAKGQERAALAADEAGSVFLVMFDGNGKSRANLSVSPNGPSLTFYDPSGQARTVIGSTSLAVSHINGERYPSSSVILFDKDGKLLFRQP